MFRSKLASPPTEPFANPTKTERKPSENRAATAQEPRTDSSPESAKKEPAARGGNRPLSWPLLVRARSSKPSVKDRSREDNDQAHGRASEPSWPQPADHALAERGRRTPAGATELIRRNVHAIQPRVLTEHLLNEARSDE